MAQIEIYTSLLLVFFLPIQFVSCHSIVTYNSQYSVCFFRNENVICFQFGISPDSFLANPSLSSFFSILTTSADKDGKVSQLTSSSINNDMIIKIS